MGKEDEVSRREFDYSWVAHLREHQLHENAHELEHAMTSEALTKADLALERRLEGMNEFRAQLEKQSGAFLTREVFEQALNNNAEKYDTIIKAIVNRHEADMDALKDEIQGEREYRKTFEGSINTWKWIATFLGASGLAGVILMFATRTP